MQISKLTKYLALSLGFTMTMNLNAQNDLSEKYSFKELNKFWNDSLEISENEQIQLYSFLVSHDEPASSFFVAQIENPNGNTQDVQVFNYALPKNYAAQIAEREILLELFKVKIDNYKDDEIENPNDIIEAQRILSDRKNQLDIYKNRVNTELTLIKIARYLESNQLQAKCARISEAAKLAEIPNAESYTKKFAISYEQYTSVLRKYKNSLEKKVECQYKLAHSMQSMTSKIEATVNDRIKETLTKKVDETIALINNNYKTFEVYLENVKQVNPQTKRILDLERQLDDMQINFNAVHNDSFNLAKGQDSILKKLDRETNENLVEVEKNPLLLKMEASYLDVFKSTKIALDNFAETAKILNQNQPYPPCVQTIELLQQLYPPLKPSQLPPVETAEYQNKLKKFNESNDICLTFIDKNTKALQQKVLNDSTNKINQEFSKHLDDLSNKLLQ